MLFSAIKNQVASASKGHWKVGALALFAVGVCAVVFGVVLITKYAPAANARVFYDACPDYYTDEFPGTTSGIAGAPCNYGSVTCDAGFHLSGCQAPVVTPGNTTCYVTCRCESDDHSCMDSSPPPPNPNPPPPPGGGPPTGAIAASPNPCSIASPATTCTSNVTWSTDNVESAEVRVSKNNGPEAQFSTQMVCSGTSCPAAFISAEPDFYEFKLYDTSRGGTTLLDQVRVTGRVVVPPDSAPRGNFDQVVCDASGSSLIGWAFDPDTPSISINVHIYRDGPAGGGGIFEGALRADQYRQDVNTSLGITGNHGFYQSPIPSGFMDGLAHTVYIYAINSNGVGPNPLLNGSPKPVQCPVVPSCPSGPGASVTVADKIIRVGGSTFAVAPNGWTGGTFSSSNTGVVSVGATQGQSATLNGLRAGRADISGQGWTASNGANGCSLGPDTVFVEDAPAGSLGSVSANPVELCVPETLAVVTLSASSNVFAEAKVYGAQGLPDGSTVFSVAANTSRNYTTGKWVKDGTQFKLIATNDGNTELASVTVRVTQKNCSEPPPVVELTANPPQVDQSHTSQLVWRQLGGPADECHAVAGPGFDTSSNTQGTDTSAPLFSDSVFTIRCTGPGGSDTKSVTVTVKPPVGGGPPTGSWVDNTLTAPASGLTVSCDQVLVTWTKATSNVDGYRIYYFDQGSVSWKPILTVPESSASLYTVGGTARLGRVVSPPTVGSPYRYRVYTYVGAFEAVALNDATGSPMAAVPCTGGGPGTGDLSPSNKDITKIRDIQLSYDTLVNQDSNVGPALPVIEGNNVSFAINLVNGGTDAITEAIRVDDVMTNLVEPPGGFKLHASCEDSGRCTLKVTAYNPTTRRLSLVVTPTAGASLAPLSAESWSITFTARTQAPANRTGQPFRFQNRAYVNDFTGPLLVTPYILVLPSGAPTIQEIQ